MAKQQASAPIPTDGPPPKRAKRTESPETEALRAVRELRKLDERRAAVLADGARKLADIDRARDDIHNGLSLGAIELVEKLTPKPDPKAAE
jgi:hypothetical protein